eukprot:TRINITY_DN5665_c0_g1_i1.p1 TRINITY_DN5665_c0_g1~~TRINITY_DN5665_c0_g1_i1.p1  ORF type:complete len:145 (+),score=9.17 TRINITY_DN5665_c0_g1_i1:1304-1738(+)
METTMIRKGNEFAAKCLMLGETHVGKTSLVSRIIGEPFNTNQGPTIGVNYHSYRREAVHEDLSLCLKLWDTAGQERFYSISKSYYRESFIILFVFDITAPASFDRIVHWLTSAQEYCTNKEGSSIRFIPVLVANKVDLLLDRVT